MTPEERRVLASWIVTQRVDILRQRREIASERTAMDMEYGTRGAAKAIHLAYRAELQLRDALAVWRNVFQNPAGLSDQEVEVFASIVVALSPEVVARITEGGH